MSSAIIEYLSARPDSATFLTPLHYAQTLEDLFPRSESLLPQPYNIFPADETQPAVLGFPLTETPVIKELDAKLDRWLTDEVAWQVTRKPDAKEKAQLSLTGYLTQVLKVSENAMMSNLLNDYHAVFWLAHSFDLARNFASIPRRVSAIDAQAGRTQGDAMKYRIYAKWTLETRELMTQLAAKAASILDGEEQRALAFFRLLQDDVLILTEEFIGPDLREVRSFINGYLRRDFQAFRDAFEKLRSAATELLQRDRSFAAALPFLGGTNDQGITVALLLDPLFQSFLFDHPSVQNAINREDREQFQLITRRVREFAVLNQLRRAIIWMTMTSDGDVLAADKRTATAYSRSTRPLDFGLPGVIDPMVHRFGLIYDISSFSETLGNIRRGGRKEEINSYRQMLVFQRKLEAIAERHLLQFEKYLGDGAFYTTRRALRLVRAAVEIQRFYAEMRKKGFAFNKGLRIALNFGYYRLLPMRGAGSERITEFYGPGIVELSRLTTGKANKEIEEFASFLVAHGYNQQKVQLFFAPLAGGADVIDHAQHAREFYAYVNSNGHLVNEGIVASTSILQELSNELQGEGQQLYRLQTSWATYVGFTPALADVEYIGVKLIGMVSLKGLDQVEIGEIVPFAPGEVEANTLGTGDPLVAALRQQFHARNGVTAAEESEDTTHERLVPSEIVVCVRPTATQHGGEVLIGEWDPASDDVRNPVLLPRADFQRLFALTGDLNVETLAVNKNAVREIYLRLSDHIYTPSVQLAAYRVDRDYQAFVLGDQVEKL